ncbi:MAG: phosphoribosylamine--glycine ligase [Pyrinomonadaceae bacterium]|nr:phosphoribosylamine--glycine ligase [Pyrinomonadaceae bacterium]
MKILVVGSGGREHAILRTLQKNSLSAAELFCAPGNSGIAQSFSCAPIKVTDVSALADFAEESKIDLTIVGGEAALAAGIANEFAARRLLVAAPTREAARLESSKIFAKDFMTRHHIPTARYRTANSVDEVRRILERGEFGSEDAPVVVKADGLAAGKGVVLARSRGEAMQAAANLLKTSAGEESKCVVLEETLAGHEVSLLLFTDGRDYKLMPAARDHKRIGENDTGANTGGMGAITSASVLDEKTKNRVVREVVEPTLEGARAEGFEFRGVLYVGLMLTTEGARVLEYNVRFGDPEAQAILIRLRSDLAETFDAVARGRLSSVSVEWSEEASACVVLAARGYPEQPEMDARIEGLESADSSDTNVEVFHAGTARDGEGNWIVAGGRVLNVTGVGATLDEALRRCYRRIEGINWEGMQYRRDIGSFGKSELDGKS